MLDLRITMDANELKYWLAFNKIPRIGRVRFIQMESHFDSLEAAWSSTASELTAAGLDGQAIRQSQIRPHGRSGTARSLGPISPFPRHIPTLPSGLASREKQRGRLSMAFRTTLRSVPSRLACLRVNFLDTLLGS